MNRARFIVAATLLGASLAAGAIAQTQPPPMTSVLAGKKFTPPFKGQADVDFTKPSTKNINGMITTTMQVKNNTNGPLLRLTVDETWYDKAGGLVTGGEGERHRLDASVIDNVQIDMPVQPPNGANHLHIPHPERTGEPSPT